MADKVGKRAAWLNANVFVDNPIDDDAVAAMQGLEIGRAMELFKEVEEKSSTIKSPSNYLAAAVRREGNHPSERKLNWGRKGEGGDFGRVRKRATWLNENVFVDRPIDDNAIAAMAGLSTHRAMELFKEVETKGDDVKNPSNYLTAAAMREGAGQTGKPSGKGGGGDFGRVRKRATWLNENVFVDRPIDDNAIAAMAGLSTHRAMELFKEVETKGDDVKNPSNYLSAATRREGAGQGVAMLPGHGGVDFEKIFKRGAWLNANVFSDRPLDDESIAALMLVPTQRAMELFKEIETKSDDVKNPGSYLKAAVQREVDGQGRGVKRALSVGSSRPAKK